MKKPALFFLLLLLVSALWAQNRYALVIGNADYPRADDKLPNTINDTNDISNELTDLGFAVTLRQNLRFRDMLREINAFIALLGSNRNSEGFFWYGGHAVELGGQNYLMPLDVDTEDEDITIATSYSVTTLLERLAGARNKVNVVVLDSCRVPPRIGGDGRGRGDTARAIKTVPQVPPDVLVVYSTASGAVAYDGDGKRNSPFTEAFKKYIKSTEPLIQMVSHVTTETMSLTSQRQRPYTSGSMSSENAYYSLNPSGSRPVQPAPSPQSSVAVGSVTVTSAIAGEILIDGKGTGISVKDGGTATITNVSTGNTEVAVKEPNGTITKAPTVRVLQGQTVAAVIERPVPANMVRIQGGTFMMGSPASEVNRNSEREVQHSVTVSSFYMGKYPVTQKEYQEVMGTNPSNFKGDSLPVEMVSWYDAINYCNRLSQREGLTPAYTVNGENVTWNQNASGYRLPTEAEWEYACRAEKTTPFSTGNNITTSQANYDGNYPYNNNAKGTYREKTTAVGSFSPNSWGLYDMHGNVWEWCWDWYGTYPSNAQTDPRGASSGSDRVLRGGSWSDDAQDLRSANRGGYTPSNRYNNIGFRLVRN
jgi:formylglycine-generating enzyme required for sulfatase activity